MATQGGFSFNNFLGTSALGDMRIDINELDDRALFIDGTKSMTGTLGMGGNLIVGFSAIEGQELAVGILPATGHVSIYVKTDKELYIQDDTGLETNITGGGSGLIGVTDDANTLLGINTSSLTSGDNNVILGFGAADFSTTMGEAVIIGKDACKNALNAGRGVFIGANSGLNADMTSGTVAIGFNTLQNLSGSTGNTTAIGFESMQTCTSGGGNTAVGALTLKLLTTGNTNTAIGRFAGAQIVDGDSNVLIGSSCGTAVNTGDSNVGVGTLSLSFLTSGSLNTSIGRSSGGLLLSGSGNLYLGNSAGSLNNGAESNNIYLLNTGVAAESSTIRIGSVTQTSCFISGIASNIPSGTPQAVIFDPLTGELGEGQVQMTGSGDMSAINSMDINGDGQILLQTSQAATDAIKLNATAGGVEIDGTGLINLTSSVANTQALTLSASNVAGGTLLSAGTGGHEISTTGSIDILSTANIISSLQLRATGTLGTVDVTTGAGFRLIDGDTQGMTWEDTGSAFNVNLKCANGMAATYGIVWPDAQGNAGDTLVNNGSGTLAWQANIGVIRDFQASDFLNSTASDWEIIILAPTIPDDIFNALNVREYLSTADSAVGMKIFIPIGETSLNVTISWRKDLANAGTVVWGLYAYNIPNGASIATGSWNLSQTISVNDPGSSINTVTTTVSLTLTNLGLTAGESCLLQIVRDVSDTFATSALLMGCTIAEGST